ncbi:MAG: ABC transporter substrate-binding protein [Sporichthyaceae bacterium]
MAIGQVGTFSGVAGPIFGSARTALAAWARDANARGGVACHPVRLFVQDDGGDPARAAAAVKDLVARQRVVAFVGSIVTFSVSGFLPAVTQAQIPAVGGDTLVPEWLQSPWMFTQGAGTDDQIVGILKAAVSAGHTKVGMLYCVEVATCGYVNKKLQSDEAKATGAGVVYSAPVSITQPDSTAQCQNAKNAGATALGVGMDGASMTRVARSCVAIGCRPLIVTGAATFTIQNSQDPNLRSLGMLTASSVAPWMVTDTPGARAFHAAVARYAPSLVPDGASMLGWTAGKLFEAAIARLSRSETVGELTTALVLDGVGRIRNETLDGLTGPLTFTPRQKHSTSNGCVYFERLSEDGWSAPTGSKPVCG